MPTDEELARGVQQGEADDLRWLVERHHAALLGFLYRLTAGDRPLAQDLAQEAFLRVMRAIHQYQYPRPFKPWLYAIAVNLVRDHYGQAEMRHTESMPEAALLQTGSLAPERLVVQQDEWQRVQTAVAQLSPQQRAAILLRYHEGMSLTDIAAALDIPIGTVKSRLSLALRALRQMLESGER